MPYAARVLIKLITGKYIRVLRAIEPLAFPCGSKCAGSVSGSDFQLIQIAHTFTMITIAGTIQPFLIAFIVSFVS